MFFTREDINKIYQALLKLGIKDSELPETSDVKNDDTLAIVQDGRNKQINVREFLNQISLWKREDFINVTDKYKKSHITLVEAIQAVPIMQRKEGLVITFLDTENNWRIYQFRGSLLQFNNETLWVDLYDFSPYIIDSILPDEEDITQSAIDEQGNTYLSLKDREYNPSEFSGKGYKILRKNIIEIEDENSNKVKKNILTKEMISEPNTIYEIRYDFDLNGAEINISENCILKFEGGSFRNGSLNGKFTIIADSRIFYNVSIINSLAYSKSKWFNIDLSGNKDCSDELIKFIYSVSKHDSVLEFTQGIYLHGDGDLTGKNYYPIKESTSQPGKYYPDIQGGASQNTGKDIKLWFEGYSNLNIVGNNSKIISHQNNGEVFNNSIISLINCNNIYIYDLTIDGNKNLRKPKLSDYSVGRIAWRNNISANNVNRLYLYNVISNNSVMDGLYLESSVHNVRVTNCIFNNNYRQGITVGNNCSNVLIYNTEVSYTGKDYGTQPMAGIDLEANAEANIENVVINNCKFIENKVSAVTMAIGAKNNVIANCYMKDSGTVGGNTSTGESYNISILNCYLENTVAYISIPGFIFKGNTLKNTENYDGIDNAITCNLLYFNYSAANVNKIGDTIISDNVIINLNKENKNVIKVEVIGNETNKSNLIYSNNILIDGYANNSVPLINIKNIKNAIFSHNEFITSLENNYSTVNILCDTFIEKNNVIKGYLSQTFKNVFKSAFEQKGITSKRPNLTTTDDGFEYYDTTLKKKILWNGTEWVNIDGTAL